MTDFFTPIEVSNTNKAELEQYEIEKYHNDPFMPTLVRIESLGDHRRKIMQWLKNMSIAARVDRLTFTNKQFACLMIAMFERISSRGRECLREFGLTYSCQAGFRISEQRFVSKPNPELLVAEQKLVESILIANRYSRYDSVTVDECLAADINELFELFDVIQNGISHELTSYNYQNYTLEKDTHIMFYNPVEYDCSITKTIGLWFVQVMKKNLCVQYFRDCSHATPSNSPSSSELLPHHLKLENAHKHKMREFRKYWASISGISRRAFTERVFNRDIRAILNEYRQTIKISGDSFPSLKYCHPDQINGFLETSAAIEGDLLFNQLMYTKLKHGSFDIGLYKYQLLLQIEAGIDKKRTEDLTAMKRKINKLAQRKVQPKHHCLNVRGGQVGLSEPETRPQTATVHEKEPVQPMGGQRLQLRRKKINGNKKCSDPLRHHSQVEVQENYSELEEKNTMEAAQLSESVEEENQKLAHEEFGKVCEEFSRRVKKWNKYQTVAVNRLITILASYNLSFQVFGSSANGLAIPNSDVDVCISPTIIDFFYSSFCTYRQKLIMGLQFLRACFENVGWASNFKLITTASVPLLIFEIDLSVAFGDPRNLVYNVPKPSKGPRIWIDLTIEPFANMQKEVVPHLGYESTVLVKQWASEFKPLGSLVCMLKHFLYKRDLNKSFTGGLSSYALTSLVYSYLKAHSEIKQKPLLDMLIQFCNYMASFDQNNIVVSPISDQPFQEKRVDKLTIQNYLNGKNLTENCYRFGEIKAELEKIGQILSDFGPAFTQKQYCRNLRNLILQ